MLLCVCFSVFLASYVGIVRFNHANRFLLRCFNCRSETRYGRFVSSLWLPSERRLEFKSIRLLGMFFSSVEERIVMTILACLAKFLIVLERLNVSLELGCFYLSFTPIE